MYKHENQYEIFEKFEKKLEQAKCNNSKIDIKKIIKDADEKWERMESIIEIQRKQIKENDAKIASLELRLDECEKKLLNEKKTQDRKMKDLENLIKSKKEKVKKDNF